VIIPYRFYFYNFFETDARRDLNILSGIFVKIIKLGRRIECFHFNVWIPMSRWKTRSYTIHYVFPSRKIMISFSSRINMTEFIYRFQFFNKMFELLVESSIVEQKETLESSDYVL
jgi:hypothetical protein